MWGERVAYALSLLIFATASHANWMLWSQVMLMPVWRGLGMLLRSTGAAIDALGAAFQGGLAPMERLMPPVNRLKYRGLGPTYPESCFVAPNATVMGNVTIGEGSSIWYGATLRGDVNSITIGRMTNIQDKAVIHVAQHNPSNAALPTVLGSHVRNLAHQVLSCCLPFLMLTYGHCSHGQRLVSGETDTKLCSPLCASECLVITSAVFCMNQSIAYLSGSKAANADLFRQMFIMHHLYSSVFVHGLGRM